METFRFHPGTTPLVVSIPHCGTHVPEAIANRLSPAARALPDTDWHVDRLYDFAAGMGASVLSATHSRYVVDLNRPPENRPLYPGADNTELCPTTTFAREPVYRPGAAPEADEIAERVARYWRPYHTRLAEALAAIEARHGIVVLFDAHSIRSEVPRFFQGRLPDLNLGTAGGASAAPTLAETLVAVCRNTPVFSHVLNGRFIGGYITRAYGRPDDGVHALQLEQAQITYMLEDPPYRYLPARADRVRPLLRALIEAMLGWAEGRARMGDVAPT